MQVGFGVQKRRPRTQFHCLNVTFGTVKKLVSEVRNKISRHLLTLLSYFATEWVLISGLSRIVMDSVKCSCQEHPHVNALWPPISTVLYGFMGRMWMKSQFLCISSFRTSTQCDVLVDLRCGHDGIVHYTDTISWGLSGSVPGDCEESPRVQGATGR